MDRFLEVKNILDGLGVDAYPVPAQNTFYFPVEVVHDGLFEACLFSIIVKSDNLIFCTYFNGEVPSKNTGRIERMLGEMNGLTLSGHFDIDEDFNEIRYRTGAPVQAAITGDWLMRQITANQTIFRQYYPALSAAIRGGISSPVGYRLHWDDLESEGEDTVLAVANLQ